MSPSKPLISALDLPKLPPLYSTEQQKNPTVQMKFHNVLNPAQYWLLIEYDPNEKLAFGFSDLGFGYGELGYFSIAEMEELQSRLAVIDVDKSFTPMPLKEAKVIAATGI